MRNYKSILIGESRVMKFMENELEGSKPGGGRSIEMMVVSQTANHENLNKGTAVGTEDTVGHYGVKSNGT